MTFKQRQQKAKELKGLIGEYIEFTLKSLAIIDVISMNEDEKIQLSNTVHGVLIDVSPYFVYIGEDMNKGYTDMIELDEIGRFGLVEKNIPDLIYANTDGETAH